MSSLTHGMKKRMSKATTLDRSINRKISAEYTEYKAKLERVEKGLQKVGSIPIVRDFWHPNFVIYRLLD